MGWYLVWANFTLVHLVDLLDTISCQLKLFVLNLRGRIIRQGNFNSKSF